MLNDHGAETFAPVESVTVMVDANLPDDVAAPVTAPVAASSVMPGGSAPADENVYGALPPTAFTPVVSGALTVVFAVQPVVGGFLPGQRLQLERRQHEDRELLRRRSPRCRSPGR